MPTRGRPEWAPQCVRHWEKQYWPETELIVIDDADAPSFPDGLTGRRIQYHRTETRLTIGAKRNLAASLSSGLAIAHFDDDDTYAPDRITDQIERLLASHKSVTGYVNLHFTDGRHWWRNTNQPGGFGASLCYWRAWWKTHPFPDLNHGEDWHFAQEATRARQFIAADAGAMMHATIHSANTSPRVIGAGWEPIKTK
jgi:glycosyltransferase involved in cell wall biosynthesis